MIGFELSNGDVITARVTQKVEFELNSPALEDDLIPGSHSLEVAIDDVDGNMNKIANANRYDLLNRGTIFDNVRLIVFGTKQYTGKLVVRRIRENGVDVFFVINGFSVAILDKLLSDVDYGADVNLGSTPAAISTAAAGYVSQDYPDVNFNFPSIYAPNLYDGEALGWASVDTVEPFDSGRTYALRELIYWTDDYVYVCVDGTSAGESPTTHPAKWVLLFSNAVINNWTDVTSDFLTNTSTYLYTQNAYALAPQLFDKFVLKKIATDIGYRIVGDFINDPQTDQSLLINTNTLDAAPPQVIVKVEQDAVYDANTNPDVVGGNYRTGLSGTNDFLHFNNEILDPDNDFTVVNPTPVYPNPPSYYTIHSEGIHRITLNVDFVAVPASGTPFKIRTYVGGVIIHTHEFSGTGVQNYTTEWFSPSGNIGDAISFRIVDNAGLAATFDYAPGSYVQIENLSANQYNAWNGTVHHANHVPDATIKQYLLSLKKRFNLSVNLNFFERTIEMNYSKDILNRAANDFTDVVQAPVADVQQPQGATITETPKASVDFITDADVTVAGTYATYQAMLDDTDTKEINDVVYVTNQGAYYILAATDNGSIEWQFHGSKLPPLVYGNGARSIAMIDAPAQLKYLYHNGDRILLPWINNKGNTTLFGGIESEQPIIHAFWYGLRTRESGGTYPFASSSIYDAAGNTIGSTDLRFIEDLPESVWRKYYEDWIRKVDLSLSFESPADFNYKDIFQLDFESPIRRRFVRYVLKRVLYEIDQSGNIKAEVQAIKLQP